MKKFVLKSSNKIDGYVTILNEMEDGYIIEISRLVENIKKEYHDYISKELLDSYIHHGYLKEIES